MFLIKDNPDQLALVALECRWEFLWKVYLSKTFMWVAPGSIQKWDSPASFSFIISLLNQILQQKNVKNVHLVSGARIRTHNLLIESPPLITWPGFPPNPKLYSQRRKYLQSETDRTPQDAVGHIPFSLNKKNH